MDYGTDLYLDENRDVVIDPAGDLKLQSEAALVAQDIREELSIPFGSVSWDPKAGSHLLDMLNSVDDEEMTIRAELERVALKDPRVDASTVKAEWLSGNRFRLDFTVLGSVEPVKLLFDLDTLFTEV